MLTPEESQADQAWERHVDFYQEAYPDVIADIATVGRTRAALMLVNQQAGDWSDAASPDLVLMLIKTAGVQASVDVGSGRFVGATGRNDFCLLPPGSASTIFVDKPHTVEALSIPYQGLLELAGGEALPGDGDFKALYRGYFADAHLHRIIGGLSTDIGMRGAGGALYGDGALLRIAGRLVDLAAPARIGHEQSARGGLSPRAARLVDAYMQDHLQTDITLGELAALVNLSPFHFSHAFKTSTGMPPHRYLIGLRIAKACELLTSTTLPISGVSALVGYDDPSYLARLFRREVGVAPLAYRLDGRQ